MRVRLAGVVCIVALTAGPGCRRRAPPPPQPLPQVPAPFASSQVAGAASDIADLVERVRPCVVNITAVHEVTIHSPKRSWPFGEWFPFLPGHRGGGDQVLRERALGSGFVIDTQGHVATNAHVVDEAEVVKVKLADGREFRARIIAKDKALDLGVIELEHAPGDLPVCSLGSSGALRVGDYVVAIGNPFGLGDTVTLGIVSAKGRALGAGPYDDFIQTDASINPGNSGGPLFDLHGQVVGIDTAIVPEGRGIGFAIPIDEVKRALPQLIATGHIARGRLGVTIQSMDDTLAKSLGLDRAQGALVADVETGGPAARGGVRPGDVILAVDAQPVSQALDLPRIVSEHAPGSQVRLTVLRDRQKRDVLVTLGVLQRPEGAASKQAP